MESYDLWKTISLFLWLINTSASVMLLAYFYGICRMAERSFKGRTYVGLLLVCIVLMAGSTLYYSLSSSVVATEIIYAVWPALAGVLLLFVAYRAHRLMMG